MKKLTLEETWTECMRMWRWIAKKIRKDDTYDVNDLKITWLEKHGYRDEDIISDCFFCEYAEYNGKCTSCPGGKVDESFNCENLEYHWQAEPLKFYEKLKELNRIRKERCSRKAKHS